MAQRNQKDIKEIKRKTKSSEKKYIAIDPGKSGGIAVLENRKVQAYKCPPTFKEMAKLIKSIKNNTHLYILERVHDIPHDGRSTAFKFDNKQGSRIGIFEYNNFNNK